MSMYLVQRIVRSLDVSTPLGVYDMSLSAEDGMIAMCPVFGNRKDAESYAKGAKIIEITVVEEGA